MISLYSHYSQKEGNMKLGHWTHLIFLLVTANARFQQQMFRKEDDYCLQGMEAREGIQTASTCATLCFFQERNCTAFVHMTQQSNSTCFLSWNLGMYCDNGPTAYRAVGVCPDSYIYNPHSDTCFRFVQTKMSWNDAKAFCEAANEHLVTFPTAASSQWLRENNEEIVQKNPAWDELVLIGGTRENENKFYIWKGLITGNVTDFDWAPNAPSSSKKRCVVITIMDGRMSAVQVQGHLCVKATN